MSAAELLLHPPSSPIPRPTWKLIAVIFCTSSSVMLMWFLRPADSDLSAETLSKLIPCSCHINPWSVPTVSPRCRPPVSGSSVCLWEMRSVVGVSGVLFIAYHPLAPSSILEVRVRRGLCPCRCRRTINAQQARSMILSMMMIAIRSRGM